MIIDSWAHLCVMGMLIAYSWHKKSDIRLMFVLFIYCAAWQMSDYLSYQEDATLFLKIFFQTSASSILIYFVTNLKYTRFTALFVGLLLVNIASLFGLVILDKFATSTTFNDYEGMFGLVNTQLIYLDLLALAGITFDMGDDKGTYRKSSYDHLRDSANMVSIKSILV